MVLRQANEDSVPPRLEGTGRHPSTNIQKLTSGSSARTTRLTVSLSTELLNRLRDAVYWTPRLTLTHLVEESLRTGLAQLESVNRSPFPPRRRELRPGRPPADQGPDQQPLSFLPKSVSLSQSDPRRVHPIADLPLEGSIMNVLSRS